MLPLVESWGVVTCVVREEGRGRGESNEWEEGEKGLKTEGE